MGIQVTTNIKSYLLAIERGNNPVILTNLYGLQNIEEKMEMHPILANRQIILFSCLNNTREAGLALSSFSNTYSLYRNESKKGESIRHLKQLLESL